MSNVLYFIIVSGILCFVLFLRHSILWFLPCLPYSSSCCFSHAFKFASLVINSMSTRHAMDVCYTMPANVPDLGWLPIVLLLPGCKLYPTLFHCDNYALCNICAILATCEHSWGVAFGRLWQRQIATHMACVSAFLSLQGFPKCGHCHSFFVLAHCGFH